MYKRQQYYEDGRQINGEIMAEIMEYIEKMEKITGKKFGDLENPLLVSVRSGARASMPGMMDTILNLGLNEDVVDVIAKKSNNPRWAWDCYRRFIQMYSDVVMEVGKKYFEQLIDAMKEKRGVKLDIELTAADLKELAEQFKAEYKEKIGEEFPQNAREQLMGAVRAVFGLHVGRELFQLPREGEHVALAALGQHLAVLAGDGAAPRLQPGADKAHQVGHRPPL